MSEDKKELNENDLDKVTGGALSLDERLAAKSDERADATHADAERDAETNINAGAFAAPCAYGSCPGRIGCDQYDSCTSSMKS